MGRRYCMLDQYGRSWKRFLSWKKGIGLCWSLFCWVPTHTLIVSCLWACSLNNESGRSEGTAWRTELRSVLKRGQSGDKIQRRVRESLTKFPAHGSRTRAKETHLMACSDSRVCSQHRRRAEDTLDFFLAQQMSVNIPEWTTKKNPPDVWSNHIVALQI